MTKGALLNPVFKAYLQNKTLLLPLSLEELIPPDHPVEWLMKKKVRLV